MMSAAAIRILTIKTSFCTQTNDVVIDEQAVFGKSYIIYIMYNHFEYFLYI
jgi:hypothetical protein